MSDERKKRIFIAIADTGGGHRAAASSLINAFEEKYNNKFEIKVQNIFEFSKRIGKTLESIYKIFSNKIPALYSIPYLLTNNKFILTLAERIMGRNVIKKVTEFIKEFKPDLIVSIHPGVNLVLKKAIERSGYNSAKAIIVTDPLTAHYGWRSQKIYDLYIVASEEVKNLFIKTGFDKSKIKIYCPPLHPNFKKAVTPEEILKLKDEFNFPKDKLIIFFAGSGEGFKNIEKYIKLLVKKPQLFNHAYFVVVTGKNKAQKDNLEKIIKDFKENFRIFGFTKQMYELTGVSDLVICKAGPATTYQALLLKKPIIHTMYMIQEKEMTQFIIKNDYGKYIPNIKSLINKLEELILNKEQLKQMNEKLDKANIVNGSYEIVEELVNLLNRSIGK